MNKHTGKIIVKWALITLGFLCLVYGLFQPLVHRFGRTATAVCDDVNAVQNTGNSYTYSVRYHYFIDGISYNGSLAFTGDFDETLAKKSSYPVRYFPLLPSHGLIDLHYRVSKESRLFTALGLIAFVLGLLVRTNKSKKSKANPSSEKKEELKNPSQFFCPACGKAIDPDSIFCNHCGRKLL